jgi:prepilin peptidase CpaA
MGAPMTQDVVAHLEQIMLAGGSLLLLAAGAHDLATRTVPNRVPAVIAVIGVGLQMRAGHLPAAVAASLAVFLVAALCWRCGWLGGGDVKLLAAAVLLVAPARVPVLVLAISLAGGVLALLYLLLGAVITGSAAPRPTLLLARILRIERRRISRHGPLPYASAIAAGVLFVLLSH